MLYNHVMNELLCRQVTQSN